VPFHVESEVIRSREAPLALAALEGLRAGVFPKMAGEFVGTGESPAAARPAAAVRLFT